MVSTPTKQPDNNGNGTPQPAEDTSATDNSHDSHDDSHNDQYSTPTDRKLLAGDLDDDSITSDREITFKNGPNARYNDSKTHQDEMDGIKDSIRLLQQNLQQSQATAEGYQASVDALADMMTNFIANNGQAAISPPAPPRQSAVTVSRNLSISDNLAMSTGRHPCDEDAIRAFFNKCTDILNDIDYTKIAKLRDLFAQDLGAVGKLPTGSSADRIKWAADFLTRLQDAPLLGAFFSPAVMGPLSLDVVALNPTFWESLGDFLRQNALSSMDRSITTALKNALPDNILTAMMGRRYSATSELNMVAFEKYFEHSPRRHKRRAYSRPCGYQRKTLTRVKLSECFHSFSNALNVATVASKKYGKKLSPLSSLNLQNRFKRNTSGKRFHGESLRRDGHPA